MESDAGRSRQLLCFLLLFSAGAAFGRGGGGGGRHVPLLLWSADSLPPLAPPTAGHITSIPELNVYLTSVFTSRPKNVILFLQDELSTDDITQFGVFGREQEKVFPNLEAALQASSWVTFPALAWTGSPGVAALLQETLGVPPRIVPANTELRFSLDASASNFLLVQLPSCPSSVGVGSCRELLRENDEILGKALSFLKEGGVAYTAVYTGQKPSRVMSEPLLFDQPGGRSLLQTLEADVTPPIMFNQSGGPCIMLWAQNLNVSRPGASEWVDLAAHNVTSLTGSTCNGTNSLLVLNYDTGYTLRATVDHSYQVLKVHGVFYPGKT